MACRVARLTCPIPSLAVTKSLQPMSGGTVAASAPPSGAARLGTGAFRHGLSGRAVVGNVTARTAAARARNRDDMAFLRYVDVLLVVLTAPFVFIADLPVLGYVVGGGVWILQRAAGLLVERKARQASDVRTAIGLNVGTLLVRAWIVGLTILAVGLAGSRDDGLMAAVLLLVVFTVYFATSLLLRPLERKTQRP
jgi:hypothetical protein